MSKYRRRLMMQEKKVIKPYMHIEALEDNLTVSFSPSLSTNAIEYSLDGSTWVTLPADTASPAIKAGRKIYFRGELKSDDDYSQVYGIGTFVISKRCNVGGNVMSLLFSDDFENHYSLENHEYSFYNLFNGCTSLVSVSENFLPATTLSNYCYGNMFRNCTSLISAPSLPATTLSSHCYTYMFLNCTSLVKAPDLLAETLIQYCYYYMFYGCSSLNYIKAMFTTTITAYFNQLTSGWVGGVASTGTFVKNKDATWNVTGENGIPSGWTVITE